MIKNFTVLEVERAKTISPIKNFSNVASNCGAMLNYPGVVEPHGDKCSTII